MQSNLGFDSTLISCISFAANAVLPMPATPTNDTQRCFIINSFKQDNSPARP